jgi:hypothetical protein
MKALVCSGVCVIGALTMKIVWRWVVRKTVFFECYVHMT